MNEFMSALGGLVDIPLLVFAALAFLLGWLAKPGARPLGFSVPVVTMLSWVVALFFGLQSLKFLANLGLKTADIVIVTQIALIIGLIWLATQHGTLVTVICIVLAIVVLFAMIATANAGPPDSLLSNFIRAVESAVTTIFDSIKLS